MHSVIAAQPLFPGKNISLRHNDLAERQARQICPFGAKDSQGGASVLAMARAAATSARLITAVPTVAALDNIRLNSAEPISAT
jgi:hypothetical protein